MSKFYPKPYKQFGKNINVKVDLSKANLKTEVDKLDIDKLVPVPVD